MRQLSAVALALCFAVVATSEVVQAQAVQAVQSVRDATDATTRETVDSIAIKLAERLGVYRYIHQALSGVQGAEAARDDLWRLIHVGETAIAARRDPELFRRRLVEFNDLEGALFARNRQVVAGLRANTAAQQLAVMQPLGLPVPQAHVLVPDVVFTVGPEGFLSTDADFVASAGISTNLLGAGVGAVFDVLGSDGLKEYFTKNLTAGTSIPFSGPGKLAAQIGLGLGGINLSGLTIWPVLNVESLDSEDDRVPDDLLENSEEEQWSSPIVSIAVVPFSIAELQSRLQAGKLVPIPIVGFRAPFYYPGDPFSSIAALFTGDRSKFRRTGPVQFVLGVSVPLLKVTPGS